MKSFWMISILFLMLVAAAGAEAQSAPAESACGKPNIKFEVKTSPVASPGAEPDKAIVFFIEQDLTTRVYVTPSTRLGMDGEWLGATSGNSYAFFAVSPGVHHLCADTKFGGVGGEGQAFLHFQAKAGATYYFEVRNTRVGDPKWSSEELHDVSLAQLDEDEGEYLVSHSELVNSQRKN
jgi:hypothetical protein